MVVLKGTVTDAIQKFADVDADEDVRLAMALQWFHYEQVFLNVHTSRHASLLLISFTQVPLCIIAFRDSKWHQNLESKHMVLKNKDGSQENVQASDQQLGMQRFFYLH